MIHRAGKIALGDIEKWTKNLLPSRQFGKVRRWSGVLCINPDADHLRRYHGPREGEEEAPGNLFQSLIDWFTNLGLVSEPLFARGRTCCLVLGSQSPTLPPAGRLPGPSGGGVSSRSGPAAAITKCAHCTFAHCTFARCIVLWPGAGGGPEPWPEVRGVPGGRRLRLHRAAPGRGGAGAGEGVFRTVCAGRRA